MEMVYHTDFGEKNKQFKVKYKIYFLFFNCFFFKCSSFAEENEELLKNWYTNYQNVIPSLTKYMCVDQLKVCCLEGYFGKQCTECPGFFSAELSKNNRECFGHGKCDVIFFFY